MAASEHPIAAHAVGEAAGALIEALAASPDLLVLFAGAAHTGAMEDIAGAVHDLLRPAAFIGCTASSVIAGDHVVAGRGGLSLWAITGVAATAHRLPTPPRGDRRTLALVDPFTFASDDLHGGISVSASGASGPGGNRLVVDGRVHHDGAVAVTLDADLEVTVTHACHPIGEPLIVTKSDGHLVLELAGRPALERVRHALDLLSPEDRSRARRGLQLGVVLDESKMIFGPGDFVVHEVVGGDPSTGAVALDAVVDVGTTVQLQVPDSRGADDELGVVLHAKRESSALVFTGTDADHDLGAISDAVGPLAIAGMTCAGAIAPIGTRSYALGGTASVAVFIAQDP